MPEDIHNRKKILANGSAIDSPPLQSWPTTIYVLPRQIGARDLIDPALPTYSRTREWWISLTVGCFYREKVVFLLFVRDEVYQQGHVMDFVQDETRERT